jgi:anti-sigma B factor antagonist
MSSEESIRSIRRDSRATVIELAGDIDLHRVSGIHHELLGVVREQPAKLIIDLAGVSYMDSSGVGMLVDVFRRVNNFNGFMALVGPNARVRNLFEITKLDRFFKIYPTLDEALRAA